MQSLSPMIKPYQPNAKEKRREREIDVNIEKIQQRKANKAGARSQNGESTPAPHTRLPTPCSCRKENQEGELERHQLHSKKR